MTSRNGRAADVMDAARVLAGVAIVVVAGVAAACTSLTAPAFHTIQADAIEVGTAPGIVFLTLRIEPATYMDALYQGAVVVDEAGCVRLDTAEGHTVIWPKDFSFEVRGGGEFRVLDAAGDVVGNLPGDFALGGGEVEVLHEGLGFSDADNTLATTHCPGRFWIGYPVD